MKYLILLLFFGIGFFNKYPGFKNIHNKLYNLACDNYCQNYTCQLIYKEQFETKSRIYYLILNNTKSELPDYQISPAILIKNQAYGAIVSQFILIF